MAARSTAALRIKPIELVRQPGAARRYEGEFGPDELDVDDERVDGDIGVDLTATSTIDGIVVRGIVSIPWSDVCRRCATPVSGVVASQVEELYQFEVTDDEAYVIDGDFIELGPVVRQYALLDLPGSPVCRGDCAGLCSICGIDLNEGTCQCAVDNRDPRWAALDDLRLDE